MKAVISVRDLETVKLLLYQLQLFNEHLLGKDLEQESVMLQRMIERFVSSDPIADRFIAD